MSLELKTVGSIVATALTISAIAAAPAHAEPAYFQADGGTETAKLKAVQDPAWPEQVWGTEFGFVVCETFSANGTAFKKTSEATLANVVHQADFFLPSKNCEAFGLEASVKLNGCDYVLDAGGYFGANSSLGDMDIVCPAGKEVEADVSGLCTVSWPAQTNFGSVFFETVAGSPSYVTALANLSGMTYSASGLLCSGESNTGTFSARMVLTAFEDNVGEKAVALTIQP